MTIKPEIPFTSNHFNDNNENPAGGTSTAPGVTITWQNGFINHEAGEQPNGAFVATVLAMVIDRMQYYQDSKFRCRENAIAITHMEEALLWMKSR